VRTIINTCIIVVIMLLQVSDTSWAGAIGKNTENFAMNGEMSEQDQRIQMCEVPNTEVDDQELVEVAVKVCYPDMKKIPDQYYINAAKLLKVEKEMCVPDEMSGMTLAAACIESGFNSNAEGDHRFSKDGKTPKAIGILQMWPVYEKAYGTDRRDVESSARGWLKNIKRQVPSVTRRCMTGTIRETWRLAWVHGVRAPKAGGRCRENVSHWGVFLKIKNRLNKNNT